MLQGTAQGLARCEVPEPGGLVIAPRRDDLAIGAIPNETNASTGLWLKAHSPVQTTFVVELANGCEGYIPPPELHPHGGYTCWRARTACLEPQAERKIRSGVLELLEKVSASP